MTGQPLDDGQHVRRAGVVLREHVRGRLTDVVRQPVPPSGQGERPAGLTAGELLVLLRPPTSAVSGA